MKAVDKTGWHHAEAVRYGLYTALRDAYPLHLELSGCIQRHLWYVRKYALRGKFRQRLPGQQLVHRQQVT